MAKLCELVSIVVPAYNVSQYIAECIKSVLNQVYSNWELIVIDDGSTDNTYDIAVKAAGADPRVHIYKQNNQGVSFARNNGFIYAKGNDIIFLDGDDFWLPECLEKLVAVKQESGAQVGYCGYNHFYNNGFYRNYRYGYPSGNILIPAIKGEVRFHLGAMLIEKNVLIDNNLRFTEGCLIGQDLEFMLKVVAVAPFQSVSKNLLMYRVRPSSATHNKWNWEKHFNAVKGVRRAAEFICEKYKGSENENIIKSELNIRLGKLLGQHLWRIVKTNSYENAMRIIEEITKDPYYATILAKFEKNSLGFLVRLKFQIVQSKNRKLWSFAKYM